MREWRRIIVFGCLGALLAACGGGSGSTGLITSEGAVIDDVRSTGTCDTFDGAPYCATDSEDAVAPGGQSAAVVTAAPSPVPTATPAAGGTGTPEPGASMTPTNGVQPTASAAPATPAPTPTPNDERTVTAVVDGFAAGAACATAARPAGTEVPWNTAALVPVDATGAPVTFPLPGDVADPLDLALLCFADPPAVLAAELATLADATPTVVFVLPEP